ncbi:MAG TPA: hypothetical protein VG870_15525 [Chitinophagaceae bacterium]|nr:hypothetical protein [Chitinophagaceae bacterium]
MKYLLALLLLVAGCPVALVAQDVPGLIRQADSLEQNLREKAALETFRQVLQQDPRNYYALWKASELCSRVGHRMPNREQQQACYEAAREYAQSAMRVNPAGADGYYSMALAMGRRAQSASGEDRLNAVRGIKANADRAIQLNPRHGRAWHVLGKWNYEVSGLNFFEKSAIRLFYGGLPQASLEEAIRCYEKARQLEPDFALNDLELAKAYDRNGERNKAIRLLQEIPQLPVRTEDDSQIRREARDLLGSWSR